MILADQWKPFGWAASFYGVICSLIALGFTPEPYLALAWFLLFFVLCAANLFFLSKVVAVTLDLMSHQGTEKGLYGTFHLMLYVGLKFAFLGAIFVSVWKSETAPMLAKMMGLGTLVAIPLFGGIWMSRQPDQKSDFRQAVN